MKQVLGDYGVAVVLIAVQRGLFKLCCRKISVLAITLMRIDWTCFFFCCFFSFLLYTHKLWLCESQSHTFE